MCRYVYVLHHHYKTNGLIDAEGKECVYASRVCILSGEASADWMVQ